MDTVFDYKEQYINYLNSVDETLKITLTLEDLFYLIISNNPSDDDRLHNTIKKMISSFKSNRASATIKSLKNLINYTNVRGLEDHINKAIYNLLIIDQVIKKNNTLLREEFDEKLNEMNNNLIISYNNEKENVINLILA